MSGIFDTIKMFLSFLWHRDSERAACVAIVMIRFQNDRDLKDIADTYQGFVDLRKREKKRGEG